MDKITTSNAIGEFLPQEAEPCPGETAGLLETVFTIDAQMQCAPQRTGGGESAASTTTDEFKHLVFQVNFCQLAIPLANLVEVLQEPKWTRIPNVPSWLLGVSNLRGDIISVVDLLPLLKMDSIHHQRSEAMIVVQSNERELVTGFVVDQLSGFRNLHGLDPAGKSTRPQYAKLPFVSRVLQSEAQQIAVLDIERLLGSAEFCRFCL